MSITPTIIGNGCSVSNAFTYEILTSARENNDAATKVAVKLLSYEVATFFLNRIEYTRINESIEVSVIKFTNKLMPILYKADVIDIPAIDKIILEKLSPRIVVTK